ASRSATAFNYTNRRTHRQPIVTLFFLARARVRLLNPIELMHLGRNSNRAFNHKRLLCASQGGNSPTFSGVRFEFADSTMGEPGNRLSRNYITRKRGP